MANDTVQEVPAGSSAGDKLRTFDDGTRKWPAGFLCYGAVSDPGPISAPTVVAGFGTPLPVGESFGGVQIDPRAIRALTSSDVVSAAQSGSWSVSITGAIPTGGNVIGAVTQSGSWTVTANQGTANTLANAWPVQVTDLTHTMPTGDAAARAIWVQGTGTFTVSGTVTATQGTSPWVDNITQFGSSNVQTGTGPGGAGIPRVTVSNDSTVGLVAGTADIGKVRFSLPTTDAMSEAIINVAASGDNTIVAGVASQTVRVYRIFFVCDAAVNVIIKDGASTNLTGAMVMTASGSFVLDLAAEPWFTTSSGNGLLINLSGAVGIRGRIYYTQS